MTGAAHGRVWAGVCVRECARVGGLAPSPSPCANAGPPCRGGPAPPLRCRPEKHCFLARCTPGHRSPPARTAAQCVGGALVPSARRFHGAWFEGLGGKCPPPCRRCRSPRPSRPGRRALPASPLPRAGLRFQGMAVGWRCCLKAVCWLWCVCVWGGGGGAPPLGMAMFVVVSRPAANVRCCPPASLPRGAAVCCARCVLLEVPCMSLACACIAPVSSPSLVTRRRFPVFCVLRFVWRLLWARTNPRCCWPRRVLQVLAL